MFWAAVLAACFFLLRVSEYTCPDQAGTDDGKGLRGIDITFRRRGVMAMIGDGRGEVDEVAICTRGSKTDQLNRGEYRNHFRTGNEDYEKTGLCVVRALENFAKLAPERFAGSARHEHLFRWSNGHYLSRQQIQTLVASAAVAEGMSPDDLGTHSLRIGGASALWARYRDTALVQRWRRWKSDAFHGYLWDARQSAQGVAQDMAAADLTMV